MDVKPLNRRMRAKCKVCNQAFITEKRVRVRQTCSPECYTKLHESIKAEASLPRCAVCDQPMQLQRKGQHRQTCGIECTRILLKRHRDAQASGVDIEGDGPDPHDPTLPLRIAEFYREQADMRWKIANRRRIRIID